MDFFDFETLTRQADIKIFTISENGTHAQGIHMPTAILAFDDFDKSVIGYPDTGLFVLFKGSCVCSTDSKFRNYIDENMKTTREIIFQSRNAAAKFVLGDKATTNYWK